MYDGATAATSMRTTASHGGAAALAKANKAAKVIACMCARQTNESARDKKPSEACTHHFARV
jgi:hypothetical protein